MDSVDLKNPCIQSEKSMSFGEFSRLRPAKTRPVEHHVSNAPDAILEILSRKLYQSVSNLGRCQKPISKPIVPLRYKRSY